VLVHLIALHPAARRNRWCKSKRGAIEMQKLIVLIVLGVLISRSPAAESPYKEARSSLEKWVETRQLISKTEAEWVSDKETLQQTVQLFERELASLNEQISKFSTNNSQVARERAEADALKSSSETALNVMREFAAGLEANLKLLAPRLPLPLQEILKPLLNRIPSEANTRMSAAERLQVCVGILSELDKFNIGVSLFSEKRTNPKGEEVAVETVYVGLGAAYFVNDSGDFAGIGVPGAKGWNWQTKSELAETIREIIQIYRNERPARFVSLPAEIH
jgi:hypothetical protein